MKLLNKNIVITGSTGGIGRELVKNLDEEGVNLILISRSDDELQNLKKELKSNCEIFSGDFSDQNEIEVLSKKISKQFKTIDVLINAAGIGVYKPIEEETLKEWNNSMNINVTSQFILIKNLSKNLRKSKDSLVLSIGSGAGVIPMAGRSIYCTSKFAVRGLTLSLAEEYRRTSVDFCLITLGSTLTSFGPMSFDEKRTEMEKGKKAYFTPDWVAKKLISIIKDNDRRTEYTLFPSNYATEWHAKS
jgi:3-oxoacyl-[acyl-carrier protein] reductase